MRSITVGLVAFACIFGGALLGVVLRSVLPAHNLTAETKDCVRLGMGLVGVVLCASGLRRVHQLRDIYVHGQAVQATVTAVAATLMRVNGQRVMRVDYRFDTIIGPARGRTTTRRPPRVGASIWVLYDGSDPRRSVAA